MKWLGMTSSQKVRCIEAIYQKMKETVDFEFPAFGSLLFGSGSTHSGTTVPLEGDFCVGPHCGPIYWNCDSKAPRYYYNIKRNAGPCESLESIGFPASSTYELT
jgi:hypothetical protein